MWDRKLVGESAYLFSIAATAHDGMPASDETRYQRPS